MKKTTLALAIAALASTAPAVHAVEYSFSGELAVELTDTDGVEDMDLDVTTTDLVLSISEKFGEVDVSGYIAYELDSDDDGLASDGAGITVEGSFGSVFVGDDGSGLQVSGLTDVMYNNSDFFFSDPTTNVIDYGLPLSGDLSVNLVVDISSDGTEEEDVDAFGVYGSYALGDISLALGYTSLTEDGAYSTGDDDSIVDFAIGYESGSISTGLGYQDVDSADDPTYGVFLTFTTGAVAITPFYEANDDESVTALNVTYSFSDNFSVFFETAAFSDEATTADADKADNSEVGLSLTF